MSDALRPSTSSDTVAGVVRQFDLPKVTPGLFEEDEFERNARFLQEALALTSSEA